MCARKAYESTLASPRQRPGLLRSAGRSTREPSAFRLSSAPRRSDHEGLVRQQLGPCSPRKTSILARLQACEELLRKAIAGARATRCVHPTGELYVFCSVGFRTPSKRLMSVGAGQPPPSRRPPCGAALSATENLPEARKWYEHAVSINPRAAAPAANNLACLYARAGESRSGGAVRTVRGLRESAQPEFPRYARVIYYRKGCTTALKSLSEAASMAPESNLPVSHRLAYAQLGGRRQGSLRRSSTRSRSHPDLTAHRKRRRLASLVY